MNLSLNLPPHALAAVREAGVDALLARGAVVVGTFPLEIDVPGSDVDVLVEARDLDAWEREAAERFGRREGFSIARTVEQGLPASLTSFSCLEVPFEIFAQALPVRQQRAYRHLIVEKRLLDERGPAFREKVMALRRAGMKTEPAFAAALGLEGDPYEALLKL